MTREEAISAMNGKIYECTTIGLSNMSIDYEDNINKIYDDIESRICENCKYSIDMNYQYLHCANKMIDTPKFCFTTSSCGRFKRKVESK